MSEQPVHTCDICGYPLTKSEALCAICAKAYELHTRRSAETLRNPESYRRHLVRLLVYPLAFDVCDQKNFAVYRERKTNE